MSDEQSAEEVIDPFALFSEDLREPVEGLAFLGQLTEEHHFCGHTFVLRTLLPHDRLAIGVVLQRYRNTVVAVDAFQLATVALALVSIDGDESFCPPVGPDLEAHARARLNWISGRWYQPTIDYLWSQLTLLEAKAAQGVIELDRLLTGSQPTNLPPWLDSLIAQGASSDETSTDTPPSTSFKSD